MIPTKTGFQVIAYEQDQKTGPTLFLLPPTFSSTTPGVEQSAPKRVPTSNCDHRQRSVRPPPNMRRNCSERVHRECSSRHKRPMIVPKRHGGGNPMSGGPAIVSHVFEADEVDILCVKEVIAGDHPTLPVDHRYVYDGPAVTGGLEACQSRSGVFHQHQMANIQEVLVGVCSFYVPQEV